jgi:hypothetical protein
MRQPATGCYELTRSGRPKASAGSESGDRSRRLSAIFSDEILSVIEGVHAYYDYCAVWKDSTQKEERGEDTGAKTTKPVNA